MTPISLSVPEAARAIGVGRTTLYELIASGDLPTMKIGRRTLVPVAGINALVARRCGAPKLTEPPTG